MCGLSTVLGDGGMMPAGFGMDAAGIPLQRQEEHVQSLNNSLAAAFTAKAAAISQERLEELMGRLETLEELLPRSFGPEFLPS